MGRFAPDMSQGITFPVDLDLDMLLAVRAKYAPDEVMSDAARVECIIWLWLEQNK